VRPREIALSESTREALYIGRMGRRHFMRKRISLLIAALMLALTMSFGGVAFAKITPVCQNPGGQEPKGQCQGQALTEENQNPAGKAPPGQNK
jgi:hypothetical protein